jgi:hypothetical protein
MDVGYAIRIVIYVVIVGFIFGILYWLAGYLAGMMGPPVGPWLQPMVIVLGALVLIGFLLHLLGIRVFRSNGSPLPPP